MRGGLEAREFLVVSIVIEGCGWDGACFCVVRGVGHDHPKFNWAFNSPAVVSVLSFSVAVWFQLCVIMIATELGKQHFPRLVDLLLIRELLHQEPSCPHSLVPTVCPRF